MKGEKLSLEPKKQLMLDLVTVLLGITFALTLFLPWWHANAGPDIYGDYIKMDVNGFGYGNAEYNIEDEYARTDLKSNHLLIQGIVLVILSLLLVLNSLIPISNEITKAHLKLVLSALMVFVVLFWIVSHGHYKVKFESSGETVSFDEIEDLWTMLASFGSAGIDYGTILALLIGLSILILSSIEIYLKKAQTTQEGVVTAKKVVKKPEEKQAKLYCSKCGAKLPPGSAFCSKCGASVEVEK